ncbi:MAG: hypothetical protein ACP5QK_04840 [Myxococcota bacterium]
MMRYKIKRFIISSLFIISFSVLSFGEEGAKIEDDEHSTSLNIITEQSIEEEIIKNLELLQNYNIVENLDEYKGIAEILEDDEDDD